MARTSGRHVDPSDNEPREDEWNEQDFDTETSLDEEYDDAYADDYADETAEPSDDELDWEPGWEPESEKKRRRTPGWLKAIRTVLILAVILALAAFAADMLQRDRFASMTDINGVSVSRMTAEEATAAVSNALQLDKAITLTDEEGNALAQLSVLELLRTGDVGSEVSRLLSVQHEQFLPLAIVGQGGGSYSLAWLDEGSLEAIIAGAIGDYGKSEGSPASLVNGPNGWELSPAKNGTAPDLTAAAENLSAVLSGGSLNVSARVAVPLANVASSFADEDAKLQKQMDAINAAMGKSVTIRFGEDLTVTLGKAELAGAYDVTLTDTGADVKLDKEKLAVVLDKLIADNEADGIARKYSLLERHGAEVHYNDWDKGWLIKRDALLKNVLSAIETGGDVAAEYDYVTPVKKHFGIANNSFIEIDLQNQYLWFYRKGNLVMSTPIVSGSTANGTPTPAGAFSVSYTKQNAKLTGAGYSYTVNYWIPFHGNIGIHDAEWYTGEYGGDAYLTSEGSHGCIQVPLEAAKLIYENASTYIPVLVY